MDQAIKPATVVNVTGLPCDDRILRNVAGLCLGQIRSRCNVLVDVEARCTIDLRLDPAVGSESFRIEDAGCGTGIVGGDHRGLLAGVGKFLRTSRYDQGGFTPGLWRGRSAPNKPMRGIYFATHFHNFYHDAPVEKVQRYIEELGLWGFNYIEVWCDLHHFKSFDAPEAVEFRRRLAAFAEAAHGVGMDFALLVLANESYDSSPSHLRAKNQNNAHRGGWYDCQVCPSVPGGTEHLLENFSRLFEWYAALRPKYVTVWPYDQGGCGCDDCRPWGGNGFQKIGRVVADLARRKIPGAKIIASTWLFDETDWRGMADDFAYRGPWADYVLAEGRSPDPLPGNLPLIGFPEISMFDNWPWGGFGANPLPRHFQQEWDEVRSRSCGGGPYSEGIFEDINKAIFSRFYWDGQPAVETVKEYAAFEFGPDHAEEVARVIETLERNHRMRWRPVGVTFNSPHWPSENMVGAKDEGAEEAHATMRKIDAKLALQARQSWRWRVLYLRSLLDAELKHSGNRPDEACNAAFGELIEIYHAKRAQWEVRPPLDADWSEAPK